MNILNTLVEEGPSTCSWSPHGSCNMATAVAAAKSDSSPMLVTTGEIPVDMEGRGAFQDAS
jgi:thiamine pyrophosphate-dependent acetolactate synthase large subunit-like protein